MKKKKTYKIFKFVSEFKLKIATHTLSFSLSLYLAHPRLLQLLRLFFFFFFNQKHVNMLSLLATLAPTLSPLAPWPIGFDSPLLLYESHPKGLRRNQREATPNLAIMTLIHHKQPHSRSLNTFTNIYTSLSLSLFG